MSGLVRHYRFVVGRRHGGYLVLEDDVPENVVSGYLHRADDVDATSETWRSQASPAKPG